MLLYLGSRYDNKFEAICKPKARCCPEPIGVLQGPPSDLGASPGPKPLSRMAQGSLVCITLHLPQDRKGIILGSGKPLESRLEGFLTPAAKMRLCLAVVKTIKTCSVRSRDATKRTPMIPFRGRSLIISHTHIYMCIHSKF